MSARQPFFPAMPASASQGATQGFNQKTFLDSSNPLHLGSQAISPTNQSESTQTAFSAPGPFSSNGADRALPPVKTSGLCGVSKKKSAHNLSQSVEKDRKGSLNSLAFLDLGNDRPGTADPRSEVYQDCATALDTQHSFGYQKASRRSMGLLDAGPGSIVRPGTTVPQSKTLQDYTAGLDIRAPIPKPATLSSSAFLSHNSMTRFSFPLVEFYEVIQPFLTGSLKMMRIYLLPIPNMELLLTLMI